MRRTRPAGDTIDESSDESDMDEWEDDDDTMAACKD